MSTTSSARRPTTRLKPSPASPAYVAAALSILTVEARHASVAGLLLSDKPSGLTPDGAFDTPFTAAEVLSAVKKTGFLQ